MGAKGGPNKTMDGLVLYLDTDNKKSFSGPPSENLVQNLVKNFSNWSGLTGSTRYYKTRSGGQGVRLVVKNGGGVQWYSSATIYNVQASTQYTISATIKYSPGTTPHPNLFYVRQYDGNGQTSESGKFSASSVKDLGGGWKRAYRTFTTDSTTTHINLQGYQYSAGAVIFLQDLQFELGSIATPYHTGTRPNTSALRGLMGNSTPTLSNVSFSSAGKVEFDGTDDYIDAGEGTSTSLQRTIEMVFKTNTIGYLYPLACYTRGGAQSVVTGKRMWLGFQDSKFRMHGWGTTDPDSTTTIQTGQYYHAVYAYDQSTKKHYIWINGVLEDNSTNTQSGFTSWNASSDHKWFVGGDPDNVQWTGNAGRSLDGEIPIFKVYDRILTTEEVQNNFNGIRSRFGI